MHDKMRKNLRVTFIKSVYGGGVEWECTSNYSVFNQMTHIFSYYSQRGLSSIRTPRTLHLRTLVLDWNIQQSTMDTHLTSVGPSQYSTLHRTNDSHTFITTFFDLRKWSVSDFHFQITPFHIQTQMPDQNHYCKICFQKQLFLRFLRWWPCFQLQELDMVHLHLRMVYQLFPIGHF